MKRSKKDESYENSTVLPRFGEPNLARTTRRQAQTPYRWIALRQPRVRFHRVVA